MSMSIPLSKDTIGCHIISVAWQQILCFTVTNTIDVRVCEPALAKQEETLEKTEQIFTESFPVLRAFRYSISFYPPPNTMVVGYVCSVMSNAVRLHGMQPAKFLCLWNFSGKDTGVGCYFLLQEIFPTQGLNSSISCIGRQILSQLCHLSANSLQSCPTLCDPLDCSPPGSSVHGILQARILKWLLYSFSLRVQKIITWTRLEVQSRRLTTRGSIPEPNQSQSTTYGAENSVLFCSALENMSKEYNYISYQRCSGPSIDKKEHRKKQFPSTGFHFGEPRKQSWGGWGHYHSLRL